MAATLRNSSFRVSFALEQDIQPDVQLFALPQDVQKYAVASKEAHREAGDLIDAQSIDTSKEYDVVLQIGHFPRTSGVTGGQGVQRAYLSGYPINRVTEQDYASLIVLGVAKYLSGKNVPVLVVPADDYPAGLKSKIFLSFHTDSAAPPCRVNASVGYDDSGDARGMHLIAYALASSRGLDAENFMRDNYTKNLQHYYGLGRATTSLFEGILEMGELSCPDQEDDMLVNAEVIALSLGRAIEWALRPADLPW